MKKIFLISLSLTLFMSLAACGTQAPVKVDNTSANVNNVGVDLTNTSKTSAQNQPKDQSEETPTTTSTLETKELDEPQELADTDVEKPASGTSDTDTQKNSQTTSEPQSNENIIVEEPLPNSTVTSPFIVKGQARVLDGTVLIRAKNKTGIIVIPTQVATTHINKADEFGPFKITLGYQFYATREGTIEVFSQSPVDGSEINMVAVPVRFE